MAHYDLVIIGTGSGNTILDDRFAEWKVAIVEEHLFGGTCTNVGCIPSKMNVYPADLARLAAHGPSLGVDTSYDGARWPEIRDRIFGKIDRIEAAGRRYRKKAPNVDVFESHCTFADNHTLLIHGDEERRLTADRIVIAAGSRVSVAPIPGLDELPDGVVHTSDTVMRVPELPRRMAVVGGGYVAAEFAHVFSSLGTDVTVIARGEALLQRQDEDVSEAFTRAASAQWDVRLSTSVERVAPGPAGTVLSLSDGSELETDVLLMAIGRSSNADRLGLENTEVEVSDGIVVVDEHQRTSVEAVWALGDVSNHWGLKHVANAEAKVVRHNMLFPDEPVAADHRFVPSAVFSFPQVASVGLTAQEARAQGIEHCVAVHDYADIAYGWAMGSQKGDTFAKLVGDATGERLLGAHVIGPQASNLIQPLIQGMSLGNSVIDMARQQYWIHPAMAEVVENALLKMVTIGAERA